MDRLEISQATRVLHGEEPSTAGPVTQARLLGAIALCDHPPHGSVELLLSSRRPRDRSRARSCLVGKILLHNSIRWRLPHWVGRDCEARSGSLERLVRPVGHTSKVAK